MTLVYGRSPCFFAVETAYGKRGPQRSGIRAGRCQSKAVSEQGSIRAERCHSGAVSEQGSVRAEQGIEPPIIRGKA